MMLTGVDGAERYRTPLKTYARKKGLPAGGIRSGIKPSMKKCPLPNGLFVLDYVYKEVYA
jgi:hypothetical protein